MGLGQHIRSDFKFLTGIAGALRRVTPMARRKTRTFPDVAEDLARRFGDKPALLSEDETLTYAAYNARGNRYARWALANGLRKGDTVCLLMPNRPEYLAVWLGITRAGGVVALLNTNLTGAALAHCINIVEPKHIIVDAELTAAFDSAAPQIRAGFTLWRHGVPAGGAPRIDEAVAAFDDGPLGPAERVPLTLEDRCLYIYTSGTTGLPKAANINHYRVLAAMEAFSAVTRATASDRMYNCLPLYHTVGGVVAVGSCLTVGGSIYIARRFSARQFWDDVVDQNCTLFQYVGELCRYLLNAPPHPKEGRHHVRLCCGNGLRPDIWLDFKKRFRIPRILEFYAATEGNAVLFNFDDTPGSVGRLPFWAKRMFPITIVRFDIEREELVRDADGLCIECAPDEVGEMISRIVIDPLKPGQRFEGYADKAATEKKIARNVFEPGDVWFRTGDLMRRDKLGYFYFVDRIGDTFRWKGENVATSEVSETITACGGIAEANVYGVRVERTEGRAGMAAVVPAEGFDLDRLHAHIHTHLSPYARPLFLRLQTTIETTATFKQRKVNLVREGFDPDKIADPLYFLDAENGRFVQVDRELYVRIQSGEVRV